MDTANGQPIAVEQVETDPRQRIGADLLGSINEKAIDAANAKIDEFCRGVAAGLGRLLGESALDGNASALSSAAMAVLLAFHDARRDADEGTWQFHEASGSLRMLVAREARRITDALASAAANSVVPVEGTIGGKPTLDERVDAAQARNGGSMLWMAKFQGWLDDGVKRGVLVDRTA